MTSLIVVVAAAQAQPLVAIVVVDQEARETGYALEIDGWLVEDALPVDVADGEVVSLVDPDGRTEPLDLRPGEAWEITGPEGEAWMSTLDKEIRTDLIAVRGPESSVKALAEALDADLHQHDGWVYLQADDILLEAPWVDDEKALTVDEVGLVRVDEKRDRSVEPVEPAPRQPAVRHEAVPAPAASDAATESQPRQQVRVGVLHEGVDSAGNSAIGSVVGTVEASDIAFTPDPRVGEDVRESYSGLFLCRDDVLWLHPSGVYGFRGIDGVWTVATPGVVRLTTDSGEVLFRAAIDPVSTFCRDVWSPEETGDPMPSGYERLPESVRKRRVHRGIGVD